jgi:hypothetical protein
MLTCRLPPTQRQTHLHLFHNLACTDRCVSLLLLLLLVGVESSNSRCQLPQQGLRCLCAAG